MIVKSSFVLWSHNIARVQKGLWMLTAWLCVCLYFSESVCSLCHLRFPVCLLCMYVFMCDPWLTGWSVLRISHFLCIIILMFRISPSRHNRLRCYTFCFHVTWNMYLFFQPIPSSHWLSSLVAASSSVFLILLSRIIPQRWFRIVCGNSLVSSHVTCSPLGCLCVENRSNHSSFSHYPAAILLVMISGNSRFIIFPILATSIFLSRRESSPLLSCYVFWCVCVFFLKLLLFPFTVLD